ncbi:hypothetical protein B296_00047115 [Ensete ventricosum]|uniref:Uncharacterized protein n=1 Tax=Ensete ventricosum TaxID=4639 RepID=A0A426XEG0_ENSVE|nr:hypothetical protein B296_00047115 [Ensete ventricosum]
MEQYDPALASIRVHVRDLYPRKDSCLCSMFHLLCRLPLCCLGTSPSSTKLFRPLICIELIVALARNILWVSPPMSLIYTSTLSVSSFSSTLGCSFTQSCNASTIILSHTRSCNNSSLFARTIKLCGVVILRYSFSTYVIRCT